MWCVSRISTVRFHRSSILLTPCPRFQLANAVSLSQVSLCLNVDSVDFLSWLQQKAGIEISSALSVGNSVYGRSLFASKFIQAGDCILKVPYSVQITPDNIIPKLASFLSDDIGGVARLAVVILAEQKKGQDSEWAPYINCLPRTGELHSTIFWTKDELEMVRQSHIYQETINHRAYIEKEFSKVKPALEHFHQNFEDVTIESFMHAYATVASRAWETSKGQSLIPFADFLNHNGVSEAFLLSDDDKEVSEVVADRDYATGEQVLISYGKFPNATLLLDFGFTLPYNVYDQARICCATMLQLRYLLTPARRREQSPHPSKRKRKRKETGTGTDCPCLCLDLINNILDRISRAICVQIWMSVSQHDPLRAMKLELLHKHWKPSITRGHGFDSSGNSFTIKEVKSAKGKGKGMPQALRAFARVLFATSAQELKDLAMEAAQNDGRLARLPLKDMSREIGAHHMLLSQITHMIREYDASIKSLDSPNSHNSRQFVLRRQMARDLLSGELRVLKSASAWLMNYCGTLSRDTGHP
ncbi:fructose-bisphosphate aldolase-lysine N-methyltransferase, chloroplastic isoform X2 [Magnolia sinica]|uniref:fructose-bisphosphate aldolase-lysine N-methyltransferase, chloroplastic isoform X2 n=1 Tax=Magnolia sinica TaxID=86752 RepID=UPI0026596847|nr:fructose-bisphosphate aldolase-lysine N-methyltransferase, chloroplastic isoform X2 [Magnolia sinica]